MKRLIISYEYKPNCPVCDGSNYDGSMKGFDSEEKLFKFVLDNINSYELHII